MTPKPCGPPREFADDLWWSVGAGADVVTILTRNFPGAASVEPAPEADDKRGVDYWVNFENGARAGVDVKYRRPDWAASENPQDDLTLETWSVIEERVPGWTRDPDKLCDYVLFNWPDSGRWCLIPFRPLLAVFQEHWRDWRRIYKTNVSHTLLGPREWHSEAVYVPRMIVLGLIQERYGGAPENAPARRGSFFDDAEKARRDLAEEL